MTIPRLPSRTVRRRGLTALVFVSIVLLLAPVLLRMAAEWPWFTALGYQRVFATRLFAELLLGFAVGAIAFAFLYASFRFAQRGVVPNPIRLSLDGGRSILDVTHLLRRLAWPVALGIALIVGFAAARGWLGVLQFLHRTPFGVTDPVFGRDVAYYVFTLPVLGSALGLGMGLVIVALLGTVVLYALRGDVVLVGRRVTVEPSARMHLAGLLAAAFVLVALRVYFVRIPGLLYSTTGPMFGASFADLHGKLLGLRLAAFAALAGALLVLWGVRTQRVARGAVIAAGLYIVVSLLGVGVYPQILQRLIVAPNELAKESPQLAHHIAATRRAWGLDRVVTRDLTGEDRLTERDIRANRATIDNVRLWDRDPLLQTFGQLQEIRTYYDFVSVDDDRYWVNGQYRQVMLSPRELNPASLPTRTFINERLTFTHGMGLTLGPVNQMTEEGLPVLFIKDLPPASNVSLRVTRPEIYFGELTDSWVFAGTGQKEFDYPAGDENIFTTYTGRGGVRVGGLLRRLVLAAHFRSLKVLLSSDITSESRALYIRNIRERSRTALPFLGFDADPYLVVTDSGRLKWVLDAYTATTRYPYAQPLRNGTNYLRNSVKVVIDAYDGDVTAFLADSTDPLARTIAKAFPGILQPLASMPADLRAHLRYPEDLFRLQSEMYATYHMAEPEIFYHREDQWQKPVLSQATERPELFMRHMIMRLPEEQQAEFIFMTPFTPRGKDNLASWMVARNDGDHYGELLVYRFPKQSLVFGPTQIVNRINQDTEFARQISLWDQGGSEVIRGNLLVIPIEESLVYVQPIYLRAQGGRIPELKRVVVAYQNRVVMEETLEEGLTRLFGGVIDPGGRAAATATPAAPARAGDAAGAALARQAAELYQRALEAQRAGDWARYGEHLARLGEVLRQLESALGSARP